MKNKKGNMFIYAGLVMIAAAGIFAGSNFYESSKAAKSAADVSQQLHIPETVVEDVPLYVSYPEMEMPTETVDGHRYIGRLEIPVLNLELPVMEEWSYDNFKIAPCRYSGTAYLNNFILAAHNYRYHFGTLNNLSEGDKMSFTDMDGNVFEYEVILKEVLEPDAIEDLLAGQWDLTLFTCVGNGSHRMVVRCKVL